jgi:RNA polymerase sigma-70 factor, ECF subfamily
MDDAPGHEITQLLQAWRRGDEGALDMLTPQVYRELPLALVVSPQPTADLVALDDALNQLAKVDHRKSQVVVMRFFGDLSVEETAVLKVSPDTVTRDWRLAKTWLMRELTEKKSDEA